MGCFRLFIEFGVCKEVLYFDFFVVSLFFEYVGNVDIFIKKINWLLNYVIIWLVFMELGILRNWWMNWRLNWVMNGF